MKKKPHYLGIDLGATSVKAGVVSAGEDLLGTSSVHVAGKKAADVLEGIISCARQAVTDAHLTIGDIAAVGVASPGPIDLKAGIICDSPNIEGWRNIPLAKLLNEALGIPAILENDANAAALGEFYCQNEPKVRVIAMYTLGTGIGGGLVIEGQALHGAHGFAAELGHVIVAPGGRKCGCGQLGCVEAYASANSTAARAAEALQAGRDSSLTRLRQGRPPNNLQGRGRARRPGRCPGLGNPGWDCLLPGPAERGRLACGRSPENHSRRRHGPGW